MKDDQVGYRSVHYVASIKSNRSGLTEYQEYKSIKFEIQIRTLLQHAWAEIEHDRNYKFSGELPSDIKRRFYLISGSLELLDREFERISEDIDRYAATIRNNTEKGYLNESINSTSLIEYLTFKLKEYDIDEKNLNGGDKKIISELSSFGINTLKDLDRLIEDNIFKKNKKHLKSTNFLGVLRNIMIFKNPKKYFEECWQHHWKAIEKEFYEDILSIYPDIKEYTDLYVIQD